MNLFIQVSLLVMVVLVIISEIYKIRFESDKESKDERGLQFINKSKSMSYSILSSGIALGIILTNILHIIPSEHFIHIIMITYFVQSIASSIVLHRSRII